MASHRPRTPGRRRGSRALRRTAAAMTIALLAAAVAASPATARTRTTTGSTTTTTTVTSVTAPRVFGVAVAGAPADLTEVGLLGDLTGRAPGEVTWYAAWATSADFPATDAARIAATGATPSVTWEPWDPAAGVSQPNYTLDRIAAGAFDGYVKRWASQIRTYQQPVVIRFAHEMNGNWYPWAEGVNGNGAGDYVAAWRHVVSVFRAAKVTNVTWEWSPNVPYAGSTSLAALYPGDTSVDRVALDGYNWGTSQTWSTWQSFADIFGPGLAELAKLTTRPVHIGETGCPEAGGDKAAWIADMFAYLDQHREVRGLTWFNLNKENDWRIQSSTASTDAFRAGLAGF